MGFIGTGLVGLCTSFHKTGALLAEEALYAALDLFGVVGSLAYKLDLSTCLRFGLQMKQHICTTVIVYTQFTSYS